MKLYIWEIQAPRQSMLCFSVWPSAITRMCNYNLAQVKFNQSPQAQRNLRLPGKRRRRGRGRKRKKEGKEKEKKRRKNEETEDGFPAKGPGQLWEFLRQSDQRTSTRAVLGSGAERGSGRALESEQKKPASRPACILYEMSSPSSYKKRGEEGRVISAGALKLTGRDPGAKCRLSKNGRGTGRKALPSEPRPPARRRVRRPRRAQAL